MFTEALDPEDPEETESSVDEGTLGSVVPSLAKVEVETWETSVDVSVKESFMSWFEYEFVDKIVVESFVESEV